MLDVFSHRALQSLYEAARSVLDNGSSPELLREPLEELEAMVRVRDSARGQAIVKEARELYSHPFGDIEDVEVDDGTYVYHNGSHGHWVMAWCFVPDSEDEEEEDAEDSDLPIYKADDPLAPRLE